MKAPALHFSLTAKAANGAGGKPDTDRTSTPSAKKFPHRWRRHIVPTSVAIFGPFPTLSPKPKGSFLSQ
ncbi:MAG: hypothetical protein LBG98_03495 [Puniceicoccales bacterium]|nr:hypothetical protein [Puniceicoccales bacterium]